MTVERRLAELRNPAVWKATVVETMEDVRDAVLIYPADPNPVTVDVKLTIVLIPRPVEKEEKERETKFVVEIKEAVEI